MTAEKTSPKKFDGRSSFFILPHLFSSPHTTIFYRMIKEKDEQ